MPQKIRDEETNLNNMLMSNKTHFELFGYYLIYSTIITCY